MSRHKKLYLLTAAIVIIVLAIDQYLKITVKTSMFMGERIDVTDWFKILFIENNGMAFGWELGGKYFLTTFRLVAVILLAWYIVRQIRRNRPKGYIICLTLILAGAAGNLIDCLFYGLIFNDPVAPEVARYVGMGKGYAPAMLGKVVDMFYFPIVEWDMPHWAWLNRVSFLPNAGEHCVFFSAIFNFADAVISCSIVVLFIWYRKLLAASTGVKAKENSENSENSENFENFENSENSENSDISKQ